MKIGLVCPYDIYKGGGVQECVRAMQSELSRRGHAVKIITPLPRRALSRKSKNIIFIGRSRDIKSPLHTTSQISVSLNNDMVEEVLNREKFDILHFHEPWVPMVSRQILARSTAKNVATFHAKLPETVMSRTIERVITPYTKSVIKHLDALTAVSQAAATYVSSLTDSPITIIPNGIDLTKYNTEARSPNPEPSIVFIGRLEKRKGVKYLLEAFALLSQNHPNAKLTIAGEGPDRIKLEILAESLNLKDIHFVGYVSDEQKKQLLSDAGVFCSPALYGESFGIVLLEALASGTPIVAGDNPGYASVMKGRGRLSILDPKDTDEFARRLELFMSDDGLRELWREWALDYVKQFSYPKVVDAYEKLYESLV